MGDRSMSAWGGVRDGHVGQLNYPTYFGSRRWECRRIPAIAGAAGGSFDLESVASQIIGGDAGGAILTVIAGVVKSMMANRQPS
jgi:hypothetical protein